ncbi:MAG: prenyltransferase [Candidatus Lokiarchaeota archaeon]|nr:prenyltransferase [Candidatus Lokiarchaeota archaeon]MBD3200136.1 prenyltransferase [Candidatus Lokiarchaeota archaeon]
MKEKIKAYIDLTRAHFAFVWPILFCTGLLLAFKETSYFSWDLLVRVALIGLFGFEAGMVLNDIVDRNLDKLDVDKENLTNYWRPFKERPIPSGKVTIKEAFIIFGLFVLISSLLIATLPLPNALYIYGFMVYGYGMEVFYQIKKRNQKFPIAQLLGRTDLTFFPIAGYLCYGQLDMTIIFIILFMYPWAIAHLGANDIVDLENDKAKDLKTVTVLYGMKGNVYWILGFSIAHIMTASLFLYFELGTIALYGFIISFSLIIIANVALLKKKNMQTGLKVLPLFHGSLLIYCISIILDSVIVI